MSKKILISGWYGHRNLGDEVILKSMVRTVENQWPKCNITVLSAEPDYTQQVHGVKAILQMLAGLKGWIRYTLSFKLFKTIKEFRNADVFVIG